MIHIVESKTGKKMFPDFFLLDVYGNYVLDGQAHTLHQSAGGFVESNMEHACQVCKEVRSPFSPASDCVCYLN